MVNRDDVKKVQHVLRDHLLHIYSEMEVARKGFLPLPPVGQKLFQRFFPWLFSEPRKHPLEESDKELRMLQWITYVAHQRSYDILTVIVDLKKSSLSERLEELEALATTLYKDTRRVGRISKEEVGQRLESLRERITEDVDAMLVLVDQL